MGGQASRVSFHQSSTGSRNHLVTIRIPEDGRKPAAIGSSFGKHAPLETDSPLAGSDLGLLLQIPDHPGQITNILQPVPFWTDQSDPPRRLPGVPAGEKGPGFLPGPFCLVGLLQDFCLTANPDKNNNQTVILYTIYDGEIVRPQQPESLAQLFSVFTSRGKGEGINVSSQVEKDVRLKIIENVIDLVQQTDFIDGASRHDWPSLPPS